MKRVFGDGVPRCRGKVVGWTSWMMFKIVVKGSHGVDGFGVFEIPLGE